MAALLRQANAKIMEGEEAKKTVAEYQELVKKQEEVIESTKENRENVGLGKIVWCSWASWWNGTKWC